ncbi:MAG: nucleotidyltransferase domain-containing protein [Nanoarchaeota archaeon]
MRTNILSFILNSNNRKNIALALFDYPDRLWSCSSLEDAVKMPHATVFRTIKGLVDFGILKTTKVNRRDLVYQLAKESPISDELHNVLTFEKRTAKIMAQKLVDELKLDKIFAILLYGSAVSGKMKSDSDIDVLFVLNKKDEELRRKINDTAAQLSVKFNKTISPVVLSMEEFKKEQKKQFLQSVENNLEVLYGETPF